MSDFVVLDRYFQSYEAHLAKNVLEAAGIECVLLNEISTQVYNFFNPGGGGIVLKVRSEDLQTAQELLSKQHPELEIDENYEVGLPENEKTQVGTVELPRSNRSIEMLLFVAAALIVLLALAAYIARILQS
ncbi:MAG: DUF2007 domain-containing protein [Flavobacteriales bacterium]|nr:DUF2007 domain-containing protein [Flavobacteriales bacterium]